MYSLSFLIVELETARATLLDVFEVSNGTPKWTWHAAIAGWAVRQNWPLIQRITSLGPISNIDDKVRRILPKISRFF